MQYKMSGLRVEGEGAAACMPSRELPPGRLLNSSRRNELPVQFKISSALWAMFKIGNSLEDSPSENFLRW